MPDSNPEHASLDSLIALGVVRSYPRNTVLFQEGDKGDQLYVIVSGKVKVFLADSDGKEIIVDVLGPGKYFGEMTLDGSPRSASVMTTEASRLSTVEHAVFKRFLADHPDAAFSLVITLIGRARNLTRAVGSLALLDVYGRVARLLLENATEESGRLIVGTPMTQQEIAKRVGASREMVWRILDDLRQGKYIAIEHNRIVIQQQLPKRW
jgi:CRP/FNR family cyclic AMP-dependent transcriptional regulator